MTGLVFREATGTDLPKLVAMLADDDMGRSREDASLPLDKAYLDAFIAITASPNEHLLVAEMEGRIVGMLQLSFIPGLSRKGAWRGQIESVRVATGNRGNGIGAAMLRHAVGLARVRGCSLVQLTSDKQRSDAHRFYGQFGFVATHEGFKLALTRP